MEELLNGLRAAGESTRLRILFALSRGELNVTELTQVLAQSQPRVSRHLKLMSDAGLLERHKEGSWVLFRLNEAGPPGALAATIAGLLDAHDPVLKQDLSRLEQVLEARRTAAAAYFSANAAQWDRIRSLHVAEGEVERAMLGLLRHSEPGLLLDLGTGTGRVLELLAPRARQAVGIDTSLDMLNVARANLEHAGLRNARVRQGDIYSLPVADRTADLVTIHQVLHFLDDPARALAEAARVLKPGGELLVVDFAPHELEFLRDEHAHRRLGIAAQSMCHWLERATLSLVTHETLPPPADSEAQGLTVSIWLARRG